MAPPLYGGNSRAGNSTHFISPVTLSSEWPSVVRLGFMSISCILCNFTNGLFVAAFFVERNLRKAGNVFLACVGASDVIVTAVVMSGSAVVLMSAGELDVLPVCRSLQFAMETATYCYSLFFVLVAAESYYRICRPKPEYNCFMDLSVSMISVSVFLASISMAGIGVFLNLDYDYCERKHYGNFLHRILSTVILHGIPGLITLLLLIASRKRVRRRAIEHRFYRRSEQYKRDLSMTSLNITAYLLYIAAWLPYMILVHKYPGTSDNNYYLSVWLGVGRSSFTSIIYCCVDDDFSRAFSDLFFYCFGKRNLSKSL